MKTSEKTTKCEKKESKKKPKEMQKTNTETKIKVSKHVY